MRRQRRIGMAIATFRRYEKKYLLTLSLIPPIISIPLCHMKMHLPLSWCTILSFYRTNRVMFSSFSMNSYVFTSSRSCHPIPCQNAFPTSLPLNAIRLILLTPSF